MLCRGLKKRKSCNHAFVIIERFPCSLLFLRTRVMVADRNPVGKTTLIRVSRKRTHRHFDVSASCRSKIRPSRTNWLSEVAAIIKPPRVVGKEVQLLTSEEARRFLDYQTKSPNDCHPEADPECPRRTQESTVSGKTLAGCAPRFPVLTCEGERVAVDDLCRRSWKRWCASSPSQLSLKSGELQVFITRFGNPFDAPTSSKSGDKRPGQPVGPKSNPSRSRSQPLN